MVITDLDGTLLQDSKRMAARDRAMLEHLGEKNILRVIATGRSLYSFERVLDYSIPLDYLVFSSGAGIAEMKTKYIVKSSLMARSDVLKSLDVLRGFSDHSVQPGYMVHYPIPDNHKFVYFSGDGNNPDFHRRCEIYKEHAEQGNIGTFAGMDASQVIAIVPDGKIGSYYDRVKEGLAPLSVVRTTSPLDGVSVWIEVFPQGISKSAACAWLAQENDISVSSVCAVGNDYNDLDLLSWAGTAFVVDNAPTELKRLFRSVSSNNEGGFCEAVQVWLSGR